MAEIEGGFEIFHGPVPDDKRPRSPEVGPLPERLRPIVAKVLGDLAWPTPLDLEIGFFEDPDWPGHGTVLFQPQGESGGFGVGVPTGAGSEIEILILLAEGLQDNLSELDQAWGQARPACPGHKHPAAAQEHSGEAWWACPRDGRLLARIGVLHDIPLDR